MKKLQSDSSSPLYHQLMQRLKEDIEKGTYPVGSRIPPEHELESLYRLSRVTVRRALAELTAEGMLERKQGKGTFVSTPRISHDLKSIHSFHDACKQNGFQPGTRVIHIREEEAGPQDLEELELREGSHIVETLRIRLADGEPVVLEKNHFSMAFAYLENENLAGSLYNILRDYGIEPKQGTHDISMTYATENQAKLLSIEPGTPLMRLHEVVFDQKGRPLHNSIQLIRGDRFVFRI
ncbi:MAG: GntR family transcriptional regulator [Clostridia bacterium]|nr:GntR family transcriptional regulator [Clostridia bacterium]